MKGGFRSSELDDFSMYNCLGGEWFLKSFEFIFHELTILKVLTISGENCCANWKHCHHNSQASCEVSPGKLHFHNAVLASIKMRKEPNTQEMPCKGREDRKGKENN